MKHSGEHPRPRILHLPAKAPRADTPRRAFGSRLRTARARAGLSLHAIADRTKVSASLFAALEDGDLSRWPRGLYRRAFFRQYIEAVGLPVAETCQDFEQVFAEDLVGEFPPEELQEDTAVESRPEPAIARALLAAAEWLTRKLSTAT